MTIPSEKSLFLIDGSSFLYRAYYALKPLQTADGKPVQAVYGFCRMLKKIIDDWNPGHMVLVWDSKGSTKRHEIYKEYKSTRQAAPSDLFDQKELIIQFADLIGLQQVMEPGVEADDLIYSLGSWWHGKGGSVVIISNDKDMGQMLSKDIVMYDAFKEKFMDDKGFEEKMGFPVKKTIFYFALLGDSVDAIPGVAGIGEKRALELVTQFDSLNDVYANIHRVAQPGVRRSLEAGKEDAFLSQKLFLFYHVPVHATEKTVLFSKDNWQNAAPFFEKLSFKSLLKGMEHQKRPVKTAHEKGYAFFTVTTQEGLEKLVAALKEKKAFAYDTEGSGLNPLLADLVGISFCYEKGKAYYIPFGHETGEEQLSKDVVLAAIKPLFEHKTIHKIAHHAKFDEHMLNQSGIRETGLAFDTILAAALVGSDWQKVSLKDLSAHYLDDPMQTFDDVVTKHKRKSFAQVPLVEATEYAANDAHQTFMLYQFLEKRLKEKGVEKLFYDIELPLVEVLFEMEEEGIICDPEVLSKVGKHVDTQLKDLYKTIIEFSGEKKEINLNSPQQVAHLLFTDLKLPVQKKTKSMGFATDAEVLEELSKMHPVPGYLIQYRELYKLKTTYIEALPQAINPKTGRIHTTFSQTRVATGRLASSDPNLQNIPSDGFGAVIRSAFIPKEGHLFLSADYSQIELRVLAHVSGDKVLIKAFKEGLDIHAMTASALLDVPAEKLTKHQRNIGKRINFSILYGLTAYGLSRDLNIPHKEAKQYIDGYFATFPHVRTWMDEVIEKTKQTGYTETVFGRRRPVPGIYERNRNLYEEACRVAVNTVGQGTAAEIVKMGMIKVYNALKKHEYDAQMVLQIHDELLLSVAERNMASVEKLVVTEMESVVHWEIPFLVHTAMGKNWQEA